VKNALNVPDENLNGKYLGMPSDIGRSINCAFKYLKERISKYIHGWLEQLLAAGGKEVLIKSVVQTIPTFSMYCLKLPRGLCEAINAMTLVQIGPSHTAEFARAPFTKRKFGQTIW
jgi:hypothetical protein